jgi:hypothetical protein
VFVDLVKVAPTKPRHPGPFPPHSGEPATSVCPLAPRQGEVALGTSGGASTMNTGGLSASSTPLPSAVPRASIRRPCAEQGLEPGRHVDEEVGRQRNMKMPSDSCFGLLFPSLDHGALGKDRVGGDQEWTEKRLKQNPPRF